MIGIALEGGAERCSFTAGVLDQLLAKNVEVAAISGTSAGAGCALSYCLGNCDAAMKMMTCPPEDRYFGVSHLLRTGQYVGLKDMAKKYALNVDFSRIFSTEIAVDFTATCCETGKVAHLTANGSAKSLFQNLMASCALPIICKPVEIEGKHYLDGSIVAPIPFPHLFQLGCEKVIVVLTGPVGCKPTDYRKFMPLLRLCYHRKYPKLYHVIMTRIAIYQEYVREMETLNKEGRLFVLRPQIPPISLFTQDIGEIQTYYQHGKTLVAEMWTEIQKWLAEKP